MTRGVCALAVLVLLGGHGTSAFKAPFTLQQGRGGVSSTRLEMVCEDGQRRRVLLAGLAVSAGWVAPAVGVHAVGDGLANQAAMLRDANLPTDVAPWWARGRYRAAHALRSAVGATALLVGAAGCWRRRRRRYAARAERPNKSHKIE